MKKALKIILAIVLTAVIILGIGWYLFVYDRDFTRDVLLQAARQYEAEGNMEAASWLYDLAYQQGSGNDEIAIELARQYIESGNYTQAEVTLNKAIKDGGGTSLYVALCKAYVAQNKLLDAVDLLDKVANPTIKAEIEAMRPSLPVADQPQGFYNQYISVTVQSNAPTLFVSSSGQYPSTDTDRYEGPITLHDGDNVLYAIAVSDEGLVSPMAIFGYTVGGIVEQVDFADPAIEELIRSLLHVSENKTLNSNDLWEIREITVPEDATDYRDLRHLAFLEKLTIENGVTDQLSILRNFSMLKELHLIHTPVSAEELSLIGSIQGLEKLTLNNCSISSVAALEKLTALTYLDLGNNAIRNIAPLVQMNMLEELYMPSNALQDISQLQSCSKLKKLDISHNSVELLTPLHGLKDLTHLDISHNLLMEIEQVAFLSNLQELRASNNSIGDLTPLTDCHELTYLDVSYNQLSEITALAGLNSMTYLNFSNNTVTSLPNWTSSCKLVTIDGSYNQIKDINVLGNLQRLNNVFMDYNEKLSSVKALAKCPLLIQVNVYGTKVKDVSDLTAQSIIVNYNPV